MNDSNDVRRALDDLIGVPPISLGRRGAVMHRIATVNRRRRLASQAALSAFVVVAATYSGVQIITATPAGNGTQLVEQDPVETPSVEPTAEPTQKPEDPTPTQVPDSEPQPTQVPDPQPDPSEEPDSEPQPTYTSKPKPTYTAKPKPTYTAKEPVAGGLTVDFFPYDTARAGSVMNWKVKAYDTSGRLMSIVVHFGDGSSKSYAPDEACGADVNVKKFFEHVYAKAGTYNAKAVVTTGGCGAATETKTEYASVKVVAADAVGNGPAKPTVTAEQVEGALLALHGADADGWVKKFYVDWGDGQETYAGPRSFDGCQNGKPSSWDTQASHDYAEPGTYTVTVTVMSTNCDADEAQTASYTLTITV